MVSVGFMHVCAIKCQLKLECWGANDKGQCDVPEEEFLKVDYVGSGSGHTCAKFTLGRVQCWGFKKMDNMNEEFILPHEIKKDVKSFVVGFMHNC